MRVRSDMYLPYNLVDVTCKISTRVEVYSRILEKYENRNILLEKKSRV